MKLRKSVSTVLALLIFITFITGCSNIEWDFYNLSKEINNLEQYHITNEMGFSLEHISPEITGVDEEKISILNSIIKKYHIITDLKVDKISSKFIYTYYLKDKNTGEVQEILNSQSDGNVLYVRVDKLFNFIKSFGDEEVNNEVNQVFANVQYISIEKEEMKNLLKESYDNDELLAEKTTEMFFNFGTYMDKNKVWREMAEGLLKDVYDGYEMGIVKEDNNRYTISLTVEDGVMVFASLIKYSIDNIEEIGSYLKEFIKTLDSTEKQLLLRAYNLDLDNFIENIDTMIENIKANKDTYTYYIDLMTSNIQNFKTINYWEGTKINYSLEKTNDNEYKVDLNGTINYNMSAAEQNTLKVVFSQKSTINTIDDISIVHPTENIMKVSELIKIKEAFEEFNKQKLVTLNLDLDNGYYISSSKDGGIEEGVMEVKVIEASSYLPLKEIGYILGEQINWDDQKRQPYVEQGGMKIFLKSIIINGNSFIPSREFENLGYEVIWDDKSNIITIQ